MDRIAWLVSFLRELTQRRVVHAVLVYIGAAFILLEATGNLVDALRLPDAITFACGVLVVLGLPLVVVLAWVYELTPQGIRRAPGSSRRKRFWVVSTTALLAITVLAGMGVMILTGRDHAPETATHAAAQAPAPDPLARGPVLALLPFQHSRDVPDMAGLTAALEAQLETVLAASPLLTVRLRHGIRPYLERGMPVDSLADRFGVDYLVQGQITTVGDVTRVVVQLADARTMRVVASGVVEPGVPGSLAFLDALTGSIEDILRPALGRDVSLQRWRTETLDSVAFRLHLQAHTRWNQVVDRATLGGLARPELAADVDELREEATRVDAMLAQATTRDPRWAEPWLCRARVALQYAIMLPRTSDDLPGWLDQAVSTVNRALELRPDDPRALALRGRILERRARLLPQDPGAESVRDDAERSLRRALEHDPDNAEAAVMLSEILYVHRGRYDQSYHFAERAYQADAFHDDWHLTVHRLAKAALEIGEDEAAARWCLEGLRRQPDNLMHNACVLEVMAWSDGPAEPDVAWRHFQALAGQSRNTVTFYRFLIAAVLARANMPDSARVVLASAVEAGLPPESALWLEAGVRFRLGEDDEALQLCRTLAEHYPAIAARQSNMRVLREFLDRPGLVEPLPG